ncbi:peptidoglycan-associated lipoprotein Pal [Thermodesulfobacteriota bacterium]
MQKKLWVSLTLVFVVIGLMFTVSCARKAIMTGMPMAEAPEAAVTAPAGDEDYATKKALNAFLYDDIYFAFDRSDLSPTAQAVLRNKAAWLQANPDAAIFVEGHCDERGTPEYNMALGDRRAESAKTFLTDLGVSPQRMTTISYGEERPVDPGSNEEAWAKNRRAHFVLE